ncbi:hypothetical protein AA11237_1822 [Acidocella aminolytica 101 = DSM 11237]|uniref:hypothetical protein n=2 Tax=Acidocella aminolytica TaxID=33998 RepID=UPI002156D5A8|nr:hypothetical protein [Acidocella aminolytica]GBQ38522.1 hypothetical protein AA11237_1822 [Acidocella aminolytica 101 = DSM 11237]
MTEAPSSKKKPTGTQKPATPVFRPGSSTAGLKPAEIKPLLTSEQTRSKPVAQGLDLADRPKIILTAGRGKTGKTTFLRWIVEMATMENKAPLLADIDPTNATFSTFFEDVSRPDTFNQTAVRDWLQDFMEYAIKEKQTAVIDLGGGDTILRTIAAEMPGFDAMIEEAGLAMVMFYLAGPHPEDLTPAATLGALGFKPRARAFVLNEGVTPPGQSRDQVFSRVISSNVYRDETADGALTLWMPRLHAAEAVEARTASFVAARDGQTEPPLGVFNRSRVGHWLKAMDAQFAGVKSWMP